MISILHLYDDNDSMAARYAAMLAQGSAPQAAAFTAGDSETFHRLFALHHPDIVHVHGLPRTSLPPGCRVVLTPHGHPMATDRPYVVVARSAMEAQALGYERTEVVRNPLITRTTTAEDCTRQMLHIYQRVMQSHVLPLMSSSTKALLALLLAAAIARDRRWLGPQADQAAELLRQADVQQLYIYATHEGVLPLLQQGLSVLSLEAPPAAPFHSYLPSGYQRPQPCASQSAADILADIDSHGPSLLRLCELSEALRDDQLDEAALLAQLDDRHLRQLLEALLPLLAEQTLLTEGFMPCPPTDNALSERLRQSLMARQQI